MIPSEAVPSNIVGLDLSTRSMGFSMFVDGRLHKFGELFYDNVDFNKRLGSIDERVEYFADYLKSDLVVIESPVKIGSIKTTISLSYSYGIVMAKFAKRGIDLKTVTPVQWQSFIGNKNFSKKESLRLKSLYPNKSNSFYFNKTREIRKERTIKWANDKFGIELRSDSIADTNVADAIGIGWYGVCN